MANLEDVHEALSRVETEVSVRINVLEQETKRYMDILNYLRSINRSKRQQPPPPPPPQSQPHPQSQSPLPPTAAAVDKHPTRVEREEKNSSKSVDELPAYLDDLLNLARSARAAPINTPSTTAPGKYAKRSSSSSCKTKTANVRLSNSSKSASKETVSRKESKAISAGGGSLKLKTSSEKTAPRDGLHSVSSSSASVITGAVDVISPYDMKVEDLVSQLKYLDSVRRSKHIRSLFCKSKAVLTSHRKFLRVIHGRFSVSKPHILNYITPRNSLYRAIISKRSETRLTDAIRAQQEVYSKSFRSRLQRLGWEQLERGDAEEALKHWMKLCILAQIAENSFVDIDARPLTTPELVLKCLRETTVHIPYDLRAVSSPNFLVDALRGVMEVQSYFQLCSSLFLESFLSRSLLKSTLRRLKELCLVQSVDKAAWREALKDYKDLYWVLVGSMNARNRIYFFEKL